MIVAPHLLDEPLGILAADEHVEIVTERLCGQSERSSEHTKTMEA
jgi:hypothetical protein